MDEFKNSEIARIFEHYPADVRKKMLLLRQLVIDAALEMENVKSFDEVLKWGEPAYIASHGSTIRLGWKASVPGQCAMYFHCKTKLIDTFKEIYHDKFTFEGNRAIIFKISDDIPVVELKHCISLSLAYHDVKHLPLLGL